MSRSTEATQVNPTVTQLRQTPIATDAAGVVAAPNLSPFGLTLVSLNNRVGLERATFAIEMLSPALAALSPDESLSIDMAGGGGQPLTAGFGGTVMDRVDAAGEPRPDAIARLLENLGRVQLPGFCMRRTQTQRVWPHSQRIVPRGRTLAILINTDRLVGPAAVTATVGKGLSDTLALPPAGLAHERLMAVAQIIASSKAPLAVSLRLRLLTLDAKMLRQVTDARRATERADPSSHMEAMRQMAQTLPDHQHLTALIDEGQAIELLFVVRSDTPVDDATAKILCHALFAAQPADETTVGPTVDTINPVTLYPRGVVLPQLITGLALTAAFSFQRPSAPYAPSRDAGVLLGLTPESQPVSIGHRDRALHTFAIGATGTGKSTMLLNQITADMAAGKGLILVDPHGDLWEQAMKRVPPNRRKDLISGHLGDPKRSFSMNVLASLGGDPAIERSATVNGLIRMFTRTLWSGVPEAFGPIFELYFRNAMLLMMEAQGDRATILEFERVFQDEDFRDELLARCKTQQVRDFWTKTAARITYNDWSLDNMNPYITSKFAPFTSNALLRPVLGSTDSSIDLPLAIAEGKIVLLNLGKGIVGEGSARLVGSLITMRLVAAAQMQMKLPEAERQPFVAYLDEFQTYATGHIAEAIEETRKYKLSLVLACQSLGQIDGSARRSDVGRSIIANVANLISFRLGVDDAAVLSKWFDPDFTSDDLLYLPNYQAIARLMVDGQALRPVEFKASPPQPEVK
jgi:Type IV secretion-system coupling protein DNA-binding domain/TraM recognition site of TraD and TraG